MSLLGGLGNSIPTFWKVPARSKENATEMCVQGDFSHTPFPKSPIILMELHSFGSPTERSLQPPCRSSSCSHLEIVVWKASTLVLTAFTLSNTFSCGDMGGKENLSSPLFFTHHFPLPPFFSPLDGTGVWTRDLTLIRQELYHLSMSHKLLARSSFLFMPSSYHSQVSPTQCLQSPFSHLDCHPEIISILNLWDQVLDPCDHLC
jgi:hypothetical protein